MIFILHHIFTDILYKATLRQETAELQLRFHSVAEQTDELRGKESQLRATNKVRNKIDYFTVSSNQS